mmetsp:Transcript_50812/g.148070  ORF Transcript_50812/g.148070 Transcript_50812/m.148070 type:complete len:336 (+) Transcript_50812:86-1093(+)
MTSEVLTAWSVLHAERRRQAVAVRDSALLCTLQSCLRDLMTVELVMSGSEANDDDKTDLALLSSMEFDIPESGDVGQLGSAILWPAELHADPARLVIVVSRALGDSAEWKARPPQKWSELLTPRPKTWHELERSLAQLVQQLILSTLRPARSESSSTTASQGSDGEQAAKELPVTGRALKRLRQRERKKMGRKARTEAAQAMASEEQARSARAFAAVHDLEGFMLEPAFDADSAEAAEAQWDVTLSDSQSEADDFEARKRNPLAKGSGLHPPMPSRSRAAACDAPQTPTLWPSTPECSPALRPAVFSEMAPLVMSVCGQHEQWVPVFAPAIVQLI